MPRDDAYIMLRGAIQRRHVPSCLQAIAAGADVNEAVYGGDRALVLAVNARATEVVEVLIEAGANVNLAEQAWHVPLVKAAALDLGDIAQLLVEAGANVNALGDNGLTALHNAAWNENADLCRFLLENGADPNLISEKGAPVLTVAARRNNVRLCRLLMEYGAHPSYIPNSAPIDYLTPFQKMVKKGNESMIRFFTNEGGADLAQKTVRGKTLMSLAPKEGGTKELLRSLRAEYAVRGAIDVADQIGPAKTCVRSKTFSPL